MLYLVMSLDDKVVSEETFAVTKVVVVKNFLLLFEYFFRFICMFQLTVSKLLFIYVVVGPFFFLQNFCSKTDLRHGTTKSIIGQYSIQL